MPRPYRLGRRALQVAETRQRIIDATHDLLTEAGAHDVSLDAVARRAGTTRATVYQRFGSREELLLAVVNEALDRADVREVRKALQHPDAAEAMRRTIRASCRFWAGEHRLFSQVKALAVVDAGVAVIDATKEGVRRGHLTNLAHRLAEQGCLRDVHSEAEAVEILLLLMSFESLDQLRARSRLSVDRAAAILVEMAERVLLA
jgi:AcrR family transcriptional regulator